MGFFSDLKEDLSQAVNELMPNEEPEGLLPTGKTPNKDTAFSGNMPTSDELSDMLDRMGDLDMLNLKEGSALTLPEEDLSAEAEPVMTEHKAAKPIWEPFAARQEPEPAKPIWEPYVAEPEPAAAQDASAMAKPEDYAAVPEPVMESVAEPISDAGEPYEEPVAEEPSEEAVNSEMSPVMSEQEEENKPIDDNGEEDKKMEVQTIVATDETAVVTEGMSITGDIISGGSLELIGSVTGNIEVLGKLNITGAIHGNSKAAEIYAEGARVNGEISAQGSVKIGQSSVIIGNISAGSAVVAGAVKGDIDVHGPVVLDTSAIVMGNIKSKSVQINNGAVIEGLCSQCYADVNPTSFFEEFKKKK